MAHSGESPYQCVIWLPLTNVYDTKGIFILKPAANKEALKHFKQWMEDGGYERIMQEIGSRLIWSEVPFGSFLLFSPTLIHGSIVNQTGETRWSLNCRFKSLLTPYGSQEKDLGCFYLPIRTTSATQFGRYYSAPAELGDK